MAGTKWGAKGVCEWCRKEDLDEGHIWICAGMGTDREELRAKIRTELATPVGETVKVRPSNEDRNRRIPRQQPREVKKLVSKIEMKRKGKRWTAWDRTDLRWVVVNMTAMREYVGVTGWWWSSQ
jgi:hypothetical protein